MRHNLPFACLVLIATLGAVCMSPLPDTASAEERKFFEADSEQQIAWIERTDPERKARLFAVVAKYSFTTPVHLIEPAAGGGAEVIPVLVDEIGQTERALAASRMLDVILAVQERCLYDVAADGPVMDALRARIDTMGRRDARWIQFCRWRIDIIEEKSQACERGLLPIEDSTPSQSSSRLLERRSHSMMVGPSRSS
ncbi:MAG: hypothetical protein HC882_07730 [Acidobacteria bacterium]|nr:hypothetical protein [Acidobacteriota bacterium]